MKALVALLLTGLLLAGCDASKPRVVAAEGGEMSSYRFNGEIEGCRLYRVYARYGEDFHLAVCGKNAVTSSSQNCGKGCSRHVTVKTDGDVTQD